MPVSPLNPKAEPVLYAAATRIILLLGTRLGLSLTDADAGTALTLVMGVWVAVEGLISWVVRHRVSPVTPEGDPVTVRQGR